MPPRQGGPRAGGCIVHEPAVLPAPVPGFHLCDCGRVAAPRCILCGRVASTDGLLRRPPSLPDAPHTLATDGVIGINLIAFAGCRLKRVSIGHREVTQALNHVLEDIRGNDAVMQQCLLPLSPRRGHLFASSHWHADRGCWLEAIDTPRGYVMQQGSEERHTVSIEAENEPKQGEGNNH